MVGSSLAVLCFFRGFWGSELTRILTVNVIVGDGREVVSVGVKICHTAELGRWLILIKPQYHKRSLRCCWNYFISKWSPHRQKSSCSEASTPPELYPCQALLHKGNTTEGFGTIQRLQLLAYAFTDYRSQGQTALHVIVDIALPPTGPSVSSIFT